MGLRRKKRAVESFYITDIKSYDWFTRFRSRVTLTLMALNLEGSLSAYCLRTCLAAKPKEHKPCRMGALKPDQRAFWSTACLKMDEIKTHHLIENPRGTIPFCLKYRRRKKKTPVEPRQMSRLSPPRAAKLGSIWRGFQSPLKRYKAACNHGENRLCLDLYLIHKPLNFSLWEEIKLLWRQ